MIICKQFVFVHVPKTGGTWMRNELRKLPSFLEERTHHVAFKEEPSEKHTFALVRNPWDWYASLYTHFHNNYVKKIHEFCNHESTWGEHERTIEHVFKGSFEDMLGKVSTHLTKGLRGSCSDTVNSMIGAPVKLHKYEDGLPMALIRTLQEVGEGWGTANLLEIYLRGETRINQHSHLRDQNVRYSPEMRRYVEQLDSSLINRFGYEFPSELSAS